MRIAGTMVSLLLLLQDPETARVSLDCKDTPIAEILAQVVKKTGVPVTMDDAAREALDPATKVSFVVRDIPLRAALELLFRPRDLTVRLVKKGFLITVQY